MFTIFCPNVNAKTLNRAKPPTVVSRSTGSNCPDAAKPLKIPSITQPTTSLAMPAATVICPKSLRMSPRSPNILATTANDETLTASMMKSTKTILGCSPATKKLSGRAPPNTIPPKRGRSILPTVTWIAGLPSLVISPRSVSKPVTTSRNAKPTQPTAKSAPDCSSSPGKYHSKPSGQTLPKMEGPRITPAASSPMMPGIPMRLIPQPSSRARITREATCIQKTSRWCSSRGISMMNFYQTLIRL